MKRIATLSIFALALVALTEQKAQAWKKWGFNMGLSVNGESGDNSCLWGAFRNGPVPGSHGHGMASTMTHGEHAYNPHGGGIGSPASFGGGYHGAAPSYGHDGFAGGFDNSFAPSYANTLPMPYGNTLPMPVQQQSAPMMPATFQLQSYWWPGY